MSTEEEAYLLLLIVFMWFVTAWEAMNLLSRGRLRKIESKDKPLSSRMESWLDHKKDYDIVFKVIIFSIISAMSVFAVKICASRKIDILGETSSVVLIIITSLLIGESVAKAILSKFDILVLKWTIPFVKSVRFSILWPFVYIIQLVQSGFEHLNKEVEEDITTKEDEIMSIVEDDDENDDISSALEYGEKQMIKGIFGLDETYVREIMQPRVDVHGLLMTASPEDAKKEFIRTGHSRIPIYDETIDEIRAIIYAKDFLDEEKIKNCTLEDLSHKPFFIPETKPVNDLLEEMRKTNTHLAVVIDEYGGTAGIVTLEDIIEEIVGEIHDEYDTDHHIDDQPKVLVDGSMVLSARTLLEDVNELMELNIAEDEDSDTIGGLICKIMGKIPEVGDETYIDDSILVRVIEADKRKIITVSLKVENDSRSKE